MEDLINKIIDYEKQAQEIIDRARERQMNLSSVVNSEVEVMRKRYIDRAQKRIETYKNTEQEYMQNMIREIDEKRQSQLKRIKVAFEQNNTIWIEDIVNSIINDI